MEKVVYSQLVSFITGNDLLASVTAWLHFGLLDCNQYFAIDSVIADGHDYAYDVISVDFMKAFDKAPHHLLVAYRCM